MAGSSNRIRVRTHRNTFSKFLLKNWAIITKITEKRSRKYTVATTGFSRMASRGPGSGAGLCFVFFIVGVLFVRFCYIVYPPGEVKSTGNGQVQYQCDNQSYSKKFIDKPMLSPYNMILVLYRCGCAGIGRLASLRCLCPYGRTGSTPVSRTSSKTSCLTRIPAYGEAS